MSTEDLIRQLREEHERLLDAVSAPGADRSSDQMLQEIYQAYRQAMRAQDGVHLKEDDAPARLPADKPAAPDARIVPPPDRVSLKDKPPPPRPNPPDRQNPQPLQEPQRLWRREAPESRVEGNRWVDRVPPDLGVPPRRREDLAGQDQPTPAAPIRGGRAWSMNVERDPLEQWNTSMPAPDQLTGDIPQLVSGIVSALRELAMIAQKHTLELNQIHDYLRRIR